MKTEVAVYLKKHTKGLTVFCSLRKNDIDPFQIIVKTDLKMTENDLKLIITQKVKS